MEKKKRRVGLKAFSFVGRCTISPLAFILPFFCPFFRSLSLALATISRFPLSASSFRFFFFLLKFSLCSLFLLQYLGGKEKVDFLVGRVTTGGREGTRRTEEATARSTRTEDGFSFVGTCDNGGCGRGTLSFVQTWERGTQRVIWERLFCSGLVNDGYGNELGRLRLLCLVTSCIAVFWKDVLV